MRISLIFLLLTVAATAAQFTEGIIGDTVPWNSSISFKGWINYISDEGESILVSSSAEVPKAVRLKVLSEEEKDAVRAAAGGSISKVKSANDAIAKKAPSAPSLMVRKGENTKIACLFEVDTKGRVGRIFRIGDGSDVYFKACVRALQEWRFAKQESPSYRAIQFETDFSVVEVPAAPPKPVAKRKSK